MFTGIVERTAEVVEWKPVATGARLILNLEPIAADLELGESVAVNGCCLTVADLSDSPNVAFDLLEETLRVTNLDQLKAGSIVNVERALRVGDRLSGHFVQGHVDTDSEILALEELGQDHRLEIALPEAYARYVVHKGSICVDGMSLTIAALTDSSFTIWITPHTFDVTTLPYRKAGDRVNLEFDFMARYLERFRALDLQ